VKRTPAQGFTPKTRKRPRADTVKSTHLKPSCHRTGTTTVPRPKPERDPRYQRIPLLTHQETHSSKQTGTTFPHQAQCGRVPARWVRTIRSLDPVRGLNPIYPSSLPLACGNLLSNIFPKSHGWFFFFEFQGIQSGAPDVSDDSLYSSWRSYCFRVMDSSQSTYFDFTTIQSRPTVVPSVVSTVQKSFKTWISSSFVILTVTDT
jgi:hypothetical protein